MYWVLLIIVLIFLTLYVFVKFKVEMVINNSLRSFTTLLVSVLYVLYFSEVCEECGNMEVWCITVAKQLISDMFCYPYYQLEYHFILDVHKV